MRGNTRGRGSGGSLGGLCLKWRGEREMRREKVREREESMREIACDLELEKEKSGCGWRRKREFEKKTNLQRREK